MVVVVVVVVVVVMVVVVVVVMAVVVVVMMMMMMMINAKRGSISVFLLYSLIRFAAYVTSLYELNMEVYFNIVTV